jgi:phosphoglycolate phosphatase
MQHYDLIVFDWDGTLMDSTAMIARCIQASCKDLGLSVPEEKHAKYIIGLGLEDALRYVAPDLAATEYPKLAERYRHHFFSSEEEILLFDGVSALLTQLVDEGYLLAVATGKGRKGLDRALEQTGLARRFHASRCADETRSKPHPEMLLELMDRLGTEPRRTLMVGDTTHDLQMAANAGCPAIAVAAGAHDRAQLEALGPLACLPSVSHLAPWLATHR